MGGLGCCDRCRCFRWFFAEKAKQLRQKSLSGRVDDGHFGRTTIDDRCRTVWGNGLDDGFLTRLGIFFFALVVADVGVGLLGERVACLHVFKARIIVFQTLKFVVRCFEVLVGDHHYSHAMTGFDFQDLAPLFIQQKCRHIDRCLYMDGSRVFLHCLFLDDAQYLQAGRFGIANVTGAIAARAGDVAAFGERRTQSLTRQFHEAKAGDLTHLHAGAIVMERIFQTRLDFALVFRVFHVDEVDHDQATQIAQTQLTGYFISGFEIGVEGGSFDIAAAGRTRGVDVH